MEKLITNPLYCYSMYDNFKNILPRIKESLDATDLKKIFDILSAINEPTLITGVGGSSVVGTFLARVLNEKNHIIATFKYPRDLNHMDLSGYKNVIAISYSGRGVAVESAFQNNLKHYLFSGAGREGAIPLQYVVKEEELSFVSMAGTFIPLSIILLYYQNDFSLIEEIFDTHQDFEVDDSLIYEIMTSNSSSTAATMLESSLVEGSLAAPVLHEKYNYCHGRTMFNFCYHNVLIYFEEDSPLDKLFQEELLPTYRKVFYLKKKYPDSIINDYYLTYLCLQLCLAISEKQGKDLSMKSVPEISETIYHFQGNIS